VTVVKEGPQEAKLDGRTVRLILVGLLTLGWKMTALVTGGAHLNESPALPELLGPPLPENVIASGFVIQRDFGALLVAKPTAAYAPTIMRLIERPTSKWGKYRLIGDCNGRTNVES